MKYIVRWKTEEKRFDNITEAITFAEKISKYEFCNSYVCTGENPEPFFRCELKI